MNNLLSQVTPLTKGLIWFTPGEIDSAKSYYKDVDYLLNGLLTASVRNTASNGSYVLVGENFGQKFYVIVGTALNEKEIRSYFDLILPQIAGESNILFIDETNEFNLIQKFAPEKIQGRIQVIK